MTTPTDNHPVTRPELSECASVSCYQPAVGVVIAPRLEPLYGMLMDVRCSFYAFCGEEHMEGVLDAHGDSVDMDTFDYWIVAPDEVDTWVRANFGVAPGPGPIGDLKVVGGLSDG